MVGTSQTNSVLCSALTPRRPCFATITVICFPSSRCVHEIFSSLEQLHHSTLQLQLLQQSPPSGTAERQALNFLWAARARNNGLGEHIEGGGFPYWVGSSAHTSYSVLGAPHSARAPPRHLWDTHREWFWPRDDPNTYGQVSVDEMNVSF